MSRFNEVPTMRLHDVLPFADRITSSRKLLALTACALAAIASHASLPQFLGAAENEKDPAIVIRPANFDPADELAYTRERGELKPGSVAHGKVWNQPEEDSRAAVSGEAPAPAGAAGPVAPVSAASGTLTPRMTYAEAYAMIPFSRSEYEANP